MVKKTVATVVGLPKAAVARIAKNSGAERVGSSAITALTTAGVDYITALSQKANTLAVHAGRKTITEGDVALAIETL